MFTEAITFNLTFLLLAENDIGLPRIIQTNQAKSSTILRSLNKNFCHTLLELNVENEAWLRLRLFI